MAAEHLEHVCVTGATWPELSLQKRHAAALEEDHAHLPTGGRVRGWPPPPPAAALVIQELLAREKAADLLAQILPCFASCKRV